MKRFMQRHAGEITGVLSGFDRMRFRGTLRWLAHTDGMAGFLNHLGVLLKDFQPYVTTVANTTVANTTVANTETMCELLRKIAAQQLAGPITVVLDNARYQRNAVVQALAEELNIHLLYLPSYSPNLNLIERLWKFLKRRALYGRYHPAFADFRAAIEAELAQLSTTHRTALASLMTHNFQQFSDVSLLAA